MGKPDYLRSIPCLLRPGNLACGEKYVREEELARQFGEGLKAIRLEWVVKALKASHADEKREHDEAVGRLQKEYNRLQSRLDAMYEDKLDGKISQDFYTDGKSLQPQ